MTKRCLLATVVLFLLCSTEGMCNDTLEMNAVYIYVRTWIAVLSCLVKRKFSNKSAHFDLFEFMSNFAQNEQESGF